MVRIPNDEARPLRIWRGHEVEIHPESRQHFGHASL
jgi:hypothetical protein